MALFKKKEKKEEKSSEIPKLPEIPQLPEMLESPRAEKEMNNFAGTKPNFSLGKPMVSRPESVREENKKDQLPQLPSFPNGSLGNKFSQDTIKEAITGRKEEEVEAEGFAEKMPMMQRSLERERTEKENYAPLSQKTKPKGTEPIFIRIDKFEEGSRTFEDVKRKISEIENMFIDLKAVREKEEKELGVWEEEIKQIKGKIEKIDSDIFSQIE